LISTSTPAGKSSLISESTVLGVGSTISMSLLWILISKCSLDFLSTCGDLITHHRQHSCHTLLALFLSAVVALPFLPQKNREQVVYPRLIFITL